MSTSNRKATKNQLQSVFSVVGSFQSPLLLSKLTIPSELELELVRSLALFGDQDCLKDTLRRNPAFRTLDSSSKVAARNRRRYLLAIKEQQTEKFEELCAHYNIPVHIKTKDLSSEFDSVLKSPERNIKKMALVPLAKPRGKF